MHRQAAWRHWWITAAALTLALVTIVVVHVVAEPGWWALGLTCVGWSAMLVSVVINRPRPYRQELRPVAGDRERRAGIKAVRRGQPIEPPARQRQAIEAVRREWFSIGLPCGIYGGLAASWVLQGRHSPSDIFDLVLPIVGYLMLLIVLAGTVYYGLVLRRLDTLDTHQDNQTSWQSSD